MPSLKREEEYIINKKRYDTMQKDFKKTFLMAMIPSAGVWIVLLLWNFIRTLAMLAGGGAFFAQVILNYANGKTQKNATKQEHAYHGLYRALINNMVVGVSTGFKKELELVGVGYRVNEKPGNTLELILGYTHSIYLQLPAEVKFETKSERNKNPLIILQSCNKQLLGMVCAKIRSFRKPEPYKGKGIKFVGEVIRRKSGKSAGAK